MSMPMPTTKASRIDLRRHYLDREIERGRKAGSEFGLSTKCRSDNHGPEGCRNDGTGCLCECHDPIEEK